MMPVYRYMDPHQGNQMSSGLNYYPSFDAVPHHTKFDPSKAVVINQPWPYPNSFNYSVPCYPYISDAHFPGYYGHAFHPHSTMPQFHCCGHHPSFPGPFPMQYVPPPYNLKELPRYEYDKPRDNGYHCCGCPNHSHNQNSGGGFKIEEQEPNMGHPLVPPQLKNYPHPVLLIPPEYMKNKEREKDLASDGATQEKSLGDIKPHQNVNPHDQVPQVRHSWFPLDMKSLQSLLQGDDGRKTLDQMDENSMKQFPFPIIWMNPHHEQGKDDKEEQGMMKDFPTIVKDTVPSTGASSVKLLNNDNGIDKAQEINENVSTHSEPKEKSSSPKIIPVKPVEVLKERDNSEDAERIGRAVAPRKINNREMEKSSGASARRDSSSPPKSKLPPVCLRVDPLPRKKSSSMSSRSPSPPGSKGRSQDKSQASQDAEVRQNTLSNNKEAEEKNSRRGAAIQVSERKRIEEKDEERSNDSTGMPVDLMVDSSNKETQQSERNDVKSTAEGIKGLEGNDESSFKLANEKQEMYDASRYGGAATAANKKKLSVDEAALRVQSYYRGYEVRKWEPLKKLKQIAEVREQMIDLKNKVHSLEFSAELQKDEKQTAVIGEMIMRLLLKLDTIQGLHPNFRDIRKALAKELVMLQENLDSLPIAICNGKPSINGEGKPGDGKEHSIDDIPETVDAISKNQDKDISDPPHHADDELKETVNNVQIVDMGSDSPSNEFMEFVDHGVLDPSTVVEVEHNQATNEGTLQLPSEKSGSEKMLCPQRESMCDEDNSEIPNLNNPQGVSKKLVASTEEQTAKDILEGCRQNSKIDSNSSDLGSLVDDSGDAAQVLEMLDELPIGVIEIEEPLHHNQAGFPKNDALLLDGDVKENAAVDAPEGLPTKHASLELEQVSGPNESKQQEILELNPKPAESCTSLAGAEGSNKNESEKERFDKVTPVVGSMKVEKDDKTVTDEIMLEECLRESQASEGCNVVEMNESLLEETQQASPLLLEKEDDEMQKEVNQEMTNVDERSIVEANNAAVYHVEEEQTQDDHDNVNQPSGEQATQGALQDHMEPHEQEIDTLNKDGSTSMLTEHDESVVETDEVCTREQDISKEDGKKLVEENEKMREMVQKLVESGKEQLAVISSLTGRLNELEQKMKQRKRRARRHRTTAAAVSSPSRKPSARKQPLTAAV